MLGHSFVKKVCSIKHRKPQYRAAGRYQRQHAAQRCLGRTIREAKRGHRFTLTERSVSLYAVDATLKTIVGIEPNRGVDALAQRQSVQGALATLKPTWNASALGETLRSAADLFHAASISAKREAGGLRELVLITDLHTGCGIDALQRLSLARSNSVGRTPSSSESTGQRATQFG